MLTARKVPRACQSCRLQLLALFEHGFTTPGAKNASRYGTSCRVLRKFQTDRISSRRFSTTRIRAQETPNYSQDDGGATSAEIEAVVRQARQTFGETLPKDYLSTEEYILYERLYGPPLRETKADDLEYVPGSEADEEEGPIRNVLLRENNEGEFEEVEYDQELGFSVAENPVEGTDVKIMEAAAEKLGDLEDVAAQVVASEREEQPIQVQGKNQREIEAIQRLQRDMDAAMAEPVEEEEEEFDEEFEEEEEKEEEEEEDEDEPGAYLNSDERLTHPHTMTGRFGTSPSTLSLPRENFVEPISELLARTNWKHLTIAAEKAFGGRGLPHSAATPPARKLIPQKHVGLDAAQHSMSEIEADAYMTAVMPGTYAAVMSTLVEVRKRLGSSWVRDMIFRDGAKGPRVLDAGAGGAGILAWREILQAEWDVLREEGIVDGEEAPSGKTTVLTGPNALRHRVSRFLENTTFLPRLPDYVHAAKSEEFLDSFPAQARKKYDLIIAPHTLFPLKEDYRRKNMVQNLWSLLDPNGGVLILIEKGLPRGFEAIAGARSLLLDSHISSPGDTAFENEIQSPLSDTTRFTKKENGMIIAPCTNHENCPMYPVPGFSSGRKDFCHFGQRYIRPPFLQRILGASNRNHEDVKFSYIAVRRGVDDRKAAEPLIQGDAATNQAFAGYEDVDLPDSEAETGASDVKLHHLSLPRAILSPLKRRGHVTLDLCTPSGKLERWTVPKSFSKTAYRDARKSKWGDLWALGAKTRTMRSPRLGRVGAEGESKSPTGLKGIRDGKMGKGGKKFKKNKFDIIMGKDGFEGIEQDRSQTKFLRPQKRTKGGRIYKEDKPISEDDL